MINKTLWTFLLVFILHFIVFGQMPNPFHEDFTVFQVDSLIQANDSNPHFVLLDVRTPDEYIPEHLCGAINRDYYEDEFEELINALPKHKLYVVYCHSGGRSANTFDLMIELGFDFVVNMLGGISEWIDEGMTTCDEFAPLLMAASDTIYPLDTTFIGYADTLFLTLTNRANDTLHFNGTSLIDDEEFNSDFDSSIYLTGAQDYTFSMIYEPEDIWEDSLHFYVYSNGGLVGFHIWRVGAFLFITQTDPFKQEILAYPNPIKDKVRFEFKHQPTFRVNLDLFTTSGLKVDSWSFDPDVPFEINMNNYSPGTYCCVIRTGKNTAMLKLLKR